VQKYLAAREKIATDALGRQDDIKTEASSAYNYRHTAFSVKTRPPEQRNRVLGLTYDFWIQTADYTQYKMLVRDISKIIGTNIPVAPESTQPGADYAVYLKVKDLEKLQRYQDTSVTSNGTINLRLPSGAKIDMPSDLSASVTTPLITFGMKVDAEKSQPKTLADRAREIARAYLLAPNAAVTMNTFDLNGNGEIDEQEAALLQETVRNLENRLKEENLYAADLVRISDLLKEMKELAADNGIPLAPSTVNTRKPAGSSVKEVGSNQSRKEVQGVPGNGRQTAMAPDEARVVAMLQEKGMTLDNPSATAPNVAASSRAPGSTGLGANRGKGEGEGIA
jgi:hypothetical protein